MALGGVTVKVVVKQLKPGGSELTAKDFIKGVQTWSEFRSFWTWWKIGLLILVGVLVLVLIGVGVMCCTRN